MEQKRHLNTLYTLLKSLNAAQWQRLKLYIHDPYNKTPAASKSLFDYMHHARKYLSPATMQVEKICAAKKNLPTALMQRVAANWLLNTVKDFLAFENFRRDDFAADYYLLREYKALHLFDFFEKDFERASAKLEQREQDNDVFFQKYYLNVLQASGFNAKTQQKPKHSLQPILRSLDEAYALQRLCIICQILHRKRTFGAKVTDTSDVSDTLASWILEVLKPYSNARYSYVYLYMHLYFILKSETFEEAEGAYNKLKRFIAAGKKPLPPSSIESAAYAAGFCLEWYNQGNLYAGEEYLWWTDFMAQHHLLFQKGKIDPAVFRNVMSIAATCDKPAEWLKERLDKYENHLPAEFQSSHGEFGLGQYYFLKKDFKKAIRHFNSAEGKDNRVFDSIIRRWKFICNYEFDKNDSGVLLDELVSFEKFLFRHKEEHSIRRKPFELFISYSKKLVRSEPDEMEANTERLRNEEHFPGKEWLLKHFKAKERRRVPSGVKSHA